MNVGDAALGVPWFTTIAGKMPANRREIVGNAALGVPWFKTTAGTAGKPGKGR